MQKGRAGYRRFERANKPPAGEAWVWITREMAESAAWRALSKPGMRFLTRVMLEHMNHGGTQNGQLICTYDQCVEFGISRRFISGAIENVVACGFVDVVERGQRAFGVARRPSTYSLTWLPRSDGSPPTNRWKSFSPVYKGEPIPVHKGELSRCTKGNRETPILNEIPSAQRGTTLNISAGQSIAVAQARAPIGSAASQACALKPDDRSRLYAQIASKGRSVEKKSGETRTIIPDMPDLPAILDRRPARC